MPIRKPDKCQEQTLFLGHDLPQQVFMLTKGLTYLTFHPITVDSMLETLLGYTNQQLYGGIVCLTFSEHVNRPQRKSSHRLAATASKERLYQFETDHALPFPEHKPCTVNHEPITVNR